MGTIPGMRPIRLSIAVTVILSFYITSSPAAAVEAFRLSPTQATTATLASWLPHHNSRTRSQELLQRSTAILSSSEKAGMPATSLKGVTGDENEASSSLSPSSISDVIITKIGSTTSMVVAGTFFIVLCYKRDALVISFFFGAIGNAILGKVLKKILKIERPEVVVAVAENGADDVIPEIDRPSDNGMPSSHAMSLGFICTFLALLLPNTTIPLLAYAAISLIYRIRVNLHSVDQIAVGAILGTFDGVVWWQLCTNGFRGVTILEWVSSSGMMNEHGLLSWYFLALPALIGALVVGSVERRLGKYLRIGSSEEANSSKHD